MKSMSIEEDTEKELSCLYTQDDNSQFVKIFQKNEFSSEEELMETAYNFSLSTKPPIGVVAPKAKKININLLKLFIWDRITKDFIEKIKV